MFRATIKYKTKLLEVLYLGGYNMVALTRGERFKDARSVHNQHKKQTMDEVAAATGLQKTLIQALEDDGNARSVGYDKVAKLAAHYGVTSDYLLGLTNDPNRKPCAADELGLSKDAISTLEIAYSFAAGENIMCGENLLLSSAGFIPIVEEIGALSKMIQEEMRIGSQYPVDSNSGDRSGLCQHDLEEGIAGCQLENRINEQFPEIVGRYRLIRTSQIIDSDMANLVDYFRRCVYHITGYNDYLNERRKIGLGASFEF